jgi:hypothetical protein
VRVVVGDGPTPEGRKPLAGGGWLESARDTVRSEEPTTVCGFGATRAAWAGKYPS